MPLPDKKLAAFAVVDFIHAYKSICRIPFMCVSSMNCILIVLVCNYGGKQYENGDTFVSVSNQCEVCECRVSLSITYQSKSLINIAGNMHLQIDEVYCEHVACSYCTHPVSSSDRCCQNCSG